MMKRIKNNIEKVTTRVRSCLRKVLECCGTQRFECYFERELDFGRKSWFQN